MQHREPASPKVSLSFPARLHNDPQVKKWAKRLAGDPNAKPTDLSEEQLRFLYEQVLIRRGDTNSQKLFQEAMAATTPTLAAPDFTHPLTDLTHIFTQPEMVAFWNTWTAPPGESGPKPNLAATKATLAYAAMTGKGPYIDDAHNDVNTNDFKSLFGAVDAAARGAVVATPLRMLGYTQTLAHVPRLGTSCWFEAMTTNIEMIKELARLNPRAGIGERLLYDCSKIPAWCIQRGSGGNAELEKALRQFTPYAGFRCYTYQSGAKRDVSSTDKLKPSLVRNVSTAWRGYYLCVISCQASTLPLVWMLIDASMDETAPIIPLLSDLFRLWPDCPADVFAADSAMDEDPPSRTLEVDYGIAPVFRIHRSAEAKEGKLLKAGESRDGSITAIDGKGRMQCAVHRQWLEFETVDRPQRVDKHGLPLRPGVSTNDSAFRVRAICKHQSPNHPPCGRVGLRMQVDWSALTRYPHYPEGSSKRYAMRQALLIRLNQAESIFNRLKSSGLGVQGPARTRIRNFEGVQALISLSLLGMTALQLADERQQRGVAVTPLPASTPLPVQVPIAAPTPLVPVPAVAAATAPVAATAAATSPAKNKQIVRRVQPAMLHRRHQETDRRRQASRR